MPLRDYETITSRQNPLIVRLAKLSDKKHREAEGLFRIDGVKLFSEAVNSGVGIVYTFVAKSAAERMASLPLESGGRVIIVPDELLAKLTDERAPQGIVAFARFFSLEECAVNASERRTLLLSSVRDPGNLGTVIRTAYAFGVDRVYLSRDCADLYSPKVLRAAMGTIFRQKLSVVDDELVFAAKMKDAGWSLYAAALNREARSLGSFELPERVCFAVGNEGHGLSDEMIAACTGTVFIPMNPGCESLNAASAATVLIWEMCREKLAMRRLTAL